MIPLCIISKVCAVNAASVMITGGPVFMTMVSIVTGSANRIIVEANRASKTITIVTAILSICASFRLGFGEFITTKQIIV